MSYGLDELRTMQDRLLHILGGDEPNAAEQMTEILQPWVDASIEDLPPEIRDVISRGIEPGTRLLEAMAGCAADAVDEVKRLRFTMHMLNKVIELRGMSSISPLVAFRLEVFLFRGGFTQGEDLHLTDANFAVMDLFVDALEAAVRSNKNRRTGPRMPPAFCRGFYWGDDGLLRYDEAREAQLQLNCTQESAAALKAYFERTRGTKFGSKKFAMDMLNIKDARTLESLPFESNTNME